MALQSQHLGEAATPAGLAARDLAASQTGSASLQTDAHASSVNRSYEGASLGASRQVTTVLIVPEKVVSDGTTFGKLQFGDAEVNADGANSYRPRQHVHRNDERFVHPSAR